MHKVLIFLCRIKWLGLIGLLGTITGNPYLKLFWLFFLLGFIDIFRNLPIFFQSLLQALSFPLIYIRHCFRLPTKDDHVSRIEYILPFEGLWFVVNGGVEKKASHSWGIPPQRYAYDFLILDENGKTSSGNDKRPEDYHCYGKNILAPADGEVVFVCDRYPDSRVYGDGSVECMAPDIRGNHITIKHDENEYSTVAHIMPGSITVEVGQNVTRGQVIARCGNSGNTSEPHIHFQINDDKSFLTSAGLPIRFKNVSAIENGKSFTTQYITRGQFVKHEDGQAAYGRQTGADRGTVLLS